MSERSLNFLIKLFLALTICSFTIITGDFIKDVTAMKYVKYIFMAGFRVTPLVIMLKIVSRIFLSGLKGRPVSFIEGMFPIYYLLLTKEARREWSDYIYEQKRKAN